MSEAGEHNVPQRIDLPVECRVDPWVAVPEEIDPPRADGVEDAVPSKS